MRTTGVLPAVRGVKVVVVVVVVGGGVINMGLVLVYVTLRSLLKSGNVTGVLAPHYHAAATWSLHEGR